VTQEESFHLFKSTDTSIDVLQEVCLLE
jgi:hypothetical protein